MFTYGGLSVAEQNALLHESTGITSTLGNMLGEFLESALNVLSTGLSL